ncbi:MAG: CotH kinase family protein, partial [Lachnospiraceae bacterium]|nr:CotH kinase family protein [Lachnospiraceae bacterium]
GKEVVFRLDENGAPVLWIKCDTGIIELNAWIDEVSENTYFFLPSFVNDDTIYFGNLSGNKLNIDGNKIKTDSKLEWQEEHAYRFEVTDAEKNVKKHNIIFLKSANVPTLFIDTDSGSMEYLNSGKENVEAGQISVIAENGRIDYQGKLPSIAGRGNSSWSCAKKTYSFNLSSAQSLCGMDSGKKWNLLSLFQEGSKLNNKVVLEMAEAMELTYTPQSVWVDLYLNGEYAGIYLLTESVSVGKGRVEVFDLEKENTALNNQWWSASTFHEEKEKGYLINGGANVTGGYLIEKDYVWYYESEPTGFVTDSNACFTIKSPKNASKEQVSYIHSYVQKIEDMIMEGVPDYDNCIDLDSFAKRFIIDEIAWNYDAGVTSMYFYKERDNDKLYSGPVWDYDLAFGETSTTWVEGKMSDYEETIVTNLRDEYEKLNWYSYLYEDERFYAAVVDKYRDFLPYMEELINVRIDEYAQQIKQAVKLDSVRWKNENMSGNKPGIYVEFDNNIRYLKFFLAKRLNYLNERWGVEYKEFEIPCNGQMHEVKFEADGKVIESIQVLDGQEIIKFPQFEPGKELGWYFSYSDEPYTSKLPIYEDVTLYAK